MPPGAAWDVAKEPDVVVLREAVEVAEASRARNLMDLLLTNLGMVQRDLRDLKAARASLTSETVVNCRSRQPFGRPSYTQAMWSWQFRGKSSMLPLCRNWPEPQLMISPYACAIERLSVKLPVRALTELAKVVAGLAQIVLEERGKTAIFLGN
jgi:hypothetical protein